jgi:hypothetical protein
MKARSEIGYISAAEFWSRWRSLYTSVFSGRRVAEGCFQNQTWRAVLLPCIRGRLDKARFRALGSTAAPLGDRQLVLTNIDIEAPHQQSASISWNVHDFEWVLSQPQFMVSDVAIFSDSGAWGSLIVRSEDGYVCVGGTAEFMEAFISACGGTEKLKDKFHDYARRAWSWPEEEKAKILRSVGW